MNILILATLQNKQIRCNNVFLTRKKYPLTPVALTTTFGTCRPVHRRPPYRATFNPLSRSVCHLSSVSHAALLLHTRNVCCLPQPVLLERSYSSTNHQFRPFLPCPCLLHRLWPFRTMFLNRRPAARYRSPASILPGRERFSWNLSF